MYLAMVSMSSRVICMAAQGVVASELHRMDAISLRPIPTSLCPYQNKLFVDNHM